MTFSNRLFNAVLSDNLDRVRRALVKTKDVNAATDSGRTILYYVRSGEVTQVLINAGARVNHRDSMQETPLHEAAEDQNAEVAKVLLDHGAEVDAQDVFLRTPLLLAIGRAFRSPDTIRVLLEAGADQHIPNIAGVTPRRHANDLDGFAYRDLVNEFDRGKRTSKRSKASKEAKKKVTHIRPSTIARKGNWWKKEHERLWDELVPFSGPAKTVQGEVIRITGKLTREASTNGNLNWSMSCTRFWRFVEGVLNDPATFSPKERTHIKESVRVIIRDRKRPKLGKGSPYDAVTKKAVEWVLAHPKFIRHKPDPRNDL